MKFLRHPRLPKPLPVRHLLIVAGPSGAGKSTFLAGLAARLLAGAVAARLPPGAAGWPQTNGRRVMRGRLDRDEAGIVEGLALHYDIMRPFETQLDGYEEDPDLAVLADADAVTVVMLRMPAGRLADRLAERPPKARLLAPVLSGLRQATGGASGRASKIYDGVREGERHRKLVALFREPDAVESWYMRWEAFLAGRLGNRLNRPFIGIEPTRDQPAGPAFQLAEITDGEAVVSVRA